MWASASRRKVLVQYDILDLGKQFGHWSLVYLWFGESNRWKDYIPLTKAFLELGILFHNS